MKIIGDISLLFQTCIPFGATIIELPVVEGLETGNTITQVEYYFSKEQLRASRAIMSPANFDDIGTTLEEDFFGFSKGDASEDDSNDAEQLIEDGNNQVLENFEARKVTREYSRTQTSRGTKSKGITLSYVDWSGFPGAAHNPENTADAKNPDRKQRRSRRANLQKEKNGGTERRSANLNRRSQRRLSGDGLVTPQTATQVKSLSPKIYRNRRHSKATAGPGPPPDSTTPPYRRAQRRSTLDNLGGAQGTERGGAGGQRQPPRNSKGGRVQRESTIQASKSLSPGGRTRRPVVAAAASTTLERRKNMERRRPRSTRHIDFNGGGSDAEEFLTKAGSLRW